MEKTYTIQTDDERTLTLVQKRIKLKQELAIVRLFTDLEIQKPEDLLDISLMDFINKLIVENKIYDFFSIILHGDFKPEDIGEIEHDTIEQIISDFFLINEKLKKRLDSLFAAIGSLLKTIIAQKLHHSQPSGSSSPSAKETSPDKRKSSNTTEPKP
jgi:hypothetical protein